MNITIQGLEKKYSDKAKMNFWVVTGIDENSKPLRYTCWSPAISSKINTTLTEGSDYTLEDKGNNYIKMSLTDKAKGSKPSSSQAGSDTPQTYAGDSERLKAMFVSYAKDLVIAVYGNIAKSATDTKDLETKLFDHLVICEKAIIDTADLMLLAITGKPKDEALGKKNDEVDLEPF